MGHPIASAATLPQRSRRHCERAYVPQSRIITIAFCDGHHNGERTYANGAATPFGDALAFHDGLMPGEDSAAQ